MAMEFVGNKGKTYTTVLPATAAFPELALADFQAIYQFLGTETEASITHQAMVARAMVHSELKEDIAQFGTLSALSDERLGEEGIGEVLYRQAVFALAAAYVVGVQISTDTTAEAADRQEALDNKRGDCMVSYRRAVDMLRNGYETLCFEAI